MTAETLRGLIDLELNQKREEGCDVAALAGLWEALRARPAAEARPELDAFWTLLHSLSGPLEAAEPSTLEAIRALRPAGPALRPVAPETLRDRLHGALLGRIAGCQLGKSIENWTKAQIDTYLAACGESEIRDYLPYLPEAPAGLTRTVNYPECCRGRMAGAQRDDDQDYTLLGLLLLDRHGAGVTTALVGQAWLELLPYHKTYTAERAAYANLVDGLAPPRCAVAYNPYREWIGAQIRADGWAYACAGQPELAAELAFRDAALSHVRNGIYGEMLFAAMIAAAFVTDDLNEAIAAGLAQIPADCRLAEAVRAVQRWHTEEPTWRGCWERIHASYGHYHPVHTINNAALVLLGLLYGEGDLSATIGIAVHGGWDTDCNGATAGSVMGALLGAAALPEHWTAPLQDRMASALFGYADNRISELAELAERLCARLAPEAAPA